MVGLRYLLFAILSSGLVLVESRSAFDEDLYENVLDSQQCNDQLNILASDQLRLKFIDASARIPSGIQQGNWNDMGDYYQCLSINEVVNDTKIMGKYAMITVPLDQDPITLPEYPNIPELPWPPVNNDTVQAVENFNSVRSYVRHITGLGRPMQESRLFPVFIASRGELTLAMCIPRVCTVEETIDFIQENITYLNLTYSPYYYRLPNDKPLAPADYTAIGILSFIGLLLLLSTSYDLYQHFGVKNECSRDPHPLYTSFSIYTNTRRFLTFRSPPGAIQCLDGIRALSMLWVVIGHTYCMILLGFVHNMQDTFLWVTKLSSVWITSAPIVVDTFFMLSGILAVYATIGKISRGRFLRSIHLFYLHRLLRIFPLLAVVVLLQASVFNYVSDGPYWLNVAHATENCRQYWWSALLHVQNYVNPMKICLAHTWYLSVDTQLYIICPVVLFFLFGREGFAWCALTGFLLLSLVSSSLYSFMNNYSAALANPSRLLEFNQYVKGYYFNTLARAPPFFVGMIYGYILHLCRDKKIRISKINVTILWFISLALMAFCIFSIHPVMQADHTAQLFDNFLNAYMRAIWAVAVGWLILACSQGYGGPINWFLCLEMWKLPARMSYAMYLIHLPIIMIANGSWLKSYYFSEGLNFYRFFGDVCLSFLASFVLSIAIDAPCSTLQKLLMGSKRPQKPIPKKAIIEEREADIIKTAL